MLSFQEIYSCKLPIDILLPNQYYQSFTTDQWHIIPEINNNSIKRIEIIASKILICLEFFYVTGIFAIGHSCHGVLDFQWERYTAMFMKHIVWVISSRTDLLIGQMLLKTLSKYLQKTLLVSSSDLVNEPSGLRSFKFRGMDWWPQKTSQDLKGPPFSITLHVFCIQLSFSTCTAPFRCLRSQWSFEQASHGISSFIAWVYSCMALSQVAMASRSIVLFKLNQSER